MNFLNGVLHCNPYVAEPIDCFEIVTYALLMSLPCCVSHKFLYQPVMMLPDSDFTTVNFISSSCVPASTCLPLSMTIIKSDLRMVDNRWAIVILQPSPLSSD